MSKRKTGRKGDDLQPSEQPQVQAKAKAQAQGRPSTLSDELAQYWADVQTAQPKAVHEARKLTRRAGAEAEVSDLKKKVRREWRDLRRAAAPIRDHDAAGEHLRAALDELQASAEDIRHFEEGWAARRAELVAAAALPTDVPTGYDLPADWEKRAAKALDADRRELLKQGKKLMKRVDGDSEPWHDWRKLMKRYRYTLELTGKAPKTVKTMLEHLGRLQDAEVLLKLLDSEPQHFNAEHLGALRSREKAARLQARAAALELWPQLKAHLKGEEELGEGVEATEVEATEKAKTAQATPTAAKVSTKTPAKAPAKTPTKTSASSKTAATKAATEAAPKAAPKTAPKAEMKDTLRTAKAKASHTEQAPPAPRISTKTSTKAPAQAKAETIASATATKPATKAAAKPTTKATPATAKTTAAPAKASRTKAATAARTKKPTSTKKTDS